MNSLKKRVVTSAFLCRGGGRGLLLFLRVLDYVRVFFFFVV